MNFNYSMEKFLHDASHEYQRVYNYRIEFDGIHILPEMIESVTIPKVSIEPFPFNWSAASIDVPAKATYEPLVITVKENINGKVYNELYEWFSDCYDLKGGTLILKKNFDEIGRKGIIYSLDNQGRDKNKWIMPFCYLLDSPGATFSYTENDVIHYEVLIRYTNFKFVSG